MFIDVLFCICGIYVIYSNIKMKSSGEIPGQLIGKKTDITRAKDIAGYIKVMYPRNFVFGASILLGAACGLLFNYGLAPVYFEIAAYIIYLVGIIYYSVVSIKYQKKYLMNY